MNFNLLKETGLRRACLSCLACSLLNKLRASEHLLDGWAGMNIKTLKEREKEHLEDVLEKTGWDLEKTARLLQISLSEVKHKIMEHGLGKPVPL